jgi:thioredoxin reductase
MEVFDVIIVGAGPAGLSAAVVLGRCQRSVLLFDSGHQRNLRSRAIHNYLTRDCISPTHFLQLGLKEIQKYGVQHKKAEIVTVSAERNGIFLVKDHMGTSYHSKKLLISTGLRDHLPRVEGFDELYGSSVFHCPYCDAWEVRNKRIAVYASNKNGVELALSLLTWTSSIFYFTDGKKHLTGEDRQTLERHGISVILDPIQKLVGANGKLISVMLKNAREYPCEALFFANGYTQQSRLVEQLGCSINKKGLVITNKFQQTKVPGVFVAGDADKDVHFAVTAAAEGARAAVVINKELQKQERLKPLVARVQDIL